MGFLLNLVQTSVIVGSARGAWSPSKDGVNTDNSNPLRLLQTGKLLQNFKTAWSSSWCVPFLQQASIHIPRSVETLKAAAYSAHK